MDLPIFVSADSPRHVSCGIVPMQIAELRGGLKAMKFSELKGKQVVAVGQAAKVGTISDVILDSSCRNIEGLVIKGDTRTPERVISVKNVNAIGGDVVTIDNTGSLKVFDPAAPEAKLPQASAIHGSQIVTQGGEVIGQISDIDFDPITRQVGGFEFSGGPFEGILGRHNMLYPRHIISLGPGLVTVSDDARPAKAA